MKRKTVRGESMTDNPDSVPLEELIGKYVLIGITRVDHLGEKIDQIQHHGFFDTLDDAGIHIRQKNTQEDFILPPDLSAFQKAKPGEYHLQTTGEVIINPDYVSTWTVEVPEPGSESDE